MGRYPDMYAEIAEAEARRDKAARDL